MAQAVIDGWIERDHAEGAEGFPQVLRRFPGLVGRGAASFVRRTVKGGRTFLSAAEPFTAGQKASSV
jgi:hypothetical protein